MLAEQIEPHSYAVKLQANQQVFRCGDVLGIRVASRFPATASTSEVRWKRKTAVWAGKDIIRSLQSRAGIFKCESPVSVLAHPFGARCFQLLCCQRKPHFQAGVTAKPVMLRPVLASSKGCRIRYHAA